MKRSVLISGSSSGLGSFLAKAFNADIFNRTSSKSKNDAPTLEYELIIHAAHGMPLKNESEYEYIEKHLRLANKLLQLPHHRFIFISSIDAAAPEKELNLYAKSKIAIEKLVVNKANNYLIIRPGSLIGNGMRKNQLIKVATEEDPQLTLSKDSTFSLVFYSDILEIINKGGLGIHPVLAKRLVTLGEIAVAFNHEPKWGGHTYTTHINPNEDILVDAPYALKELDPIFRLKEFMPSKTYPETNLNSPNIAQ